MPPKHKKPRTAKKAPSQPLRTPNAALCEATPPFRRKSGGRNRKSEITRYSNPSPEQINPLEGILHDAPLETENLKLETPAARGSAPFFSAPDAGVWLYHANCLEVMDSIFAKYPEGRFDMIFADPPYFLSNGGITCHAGRMVSVHKGDWDQSRGPEWNHEFNTEWLKRCQRVLKPNGTLWVTGTHHVIFSVGFALQQLGFKILNDIAWEKPNPPPNLSCRYFTHSTETILWAAKNEKSKHTFNYAAMKAVTGKQMKTVWRKEEFPMGSAPAPGCGSSRPRDEHSLPSQTSPNSALRTPNSAIEPIWTMPAPSNAEKLHGKHPTQKPIALVERCLLASTNPGDLVLDPFLGGGTTAVACVRFGRGFVGIELDLTHLSLATRRADAEIITLWLRHFRVQICITVTAKNNILPPETSPSPAGAGEGRGEGRRGKTNREGENPPRLDPGEGRGEGGGEKIKRPPSPAGAGEGRGEGRRGRTNQGEGGHNLRFHQKFLDLFPNLIDRSAPMADKPDMPTERIFHETKFVFLSCAQVSSASVVHTTVDVSLQEAWTNAPSGKKRETTHIVRCETEILRVKKELKS